MIMMMLQRLLIQQLRNFQALTAFSINGRVFMLWRQIKQKLQIITNLNIMKNSETNNIQSHSINTGLCDGFLIPMTDFVNNVGNMENYPSHENALSWIYNYAKFLKQPLKLEMFVPCDEGGNVFEKPSDEELEKFKGLEYGAFDCNYTYIFDYNLAKEKVLFENLSYKFGFVGLTDSKGNFSSLFDLDFKPNGIIEDLLKEKYKFSFTAFALDSIFGETVA